MLIFILQASPSVPVQLGPWGTLILTSMVLLSGAITLFLGIIAYRQRTWRSTADAAVAEMNVHKEAAERLRGEMTECRAEVERYKALTDIAPVVRAITDWRDEGRSRFTSAETKLEINTQKIEANTKAVVELINEVKAQRTTSEDAYRQLTAAFIAHTIEDKEQQLRRTESELRVASALDEVERRLSQVAVQVGVAKWETAEIRGGPRIPPQAPRVETAKKK